ncbi:hypothetical protein [Nocardia sp. CS682]|nr:hypothetical protein [Nocardia sp. CS682]
MRMPAPSLARHEACGIRLPDGWVRSEKPADRAMPHAMQTRNISQNKEG